MGVSCSQLGRDCVHYVKISGPPADQSRDGLSAHAPRFVPLDIFGVLQTSGVPDEYREWVGEPCRQVEVIAKRLKEGKEEDGRSTKWDEDEN